MESTKRVARPQAAQWRFKVLVGLLYFSTLNHCSVKLFSAQTFLVLVWGEWNDYTNKLCPRKHNNILLHPVSRMLSNKPLKIVFPV